MKKPFLSKLILGVAIVGMSLATSCKDEKNAETETPTETSTDAAAETGEDKNVAQVNPEHGLPGHRCDIPVGAPLNSAAANRTTPTPTPATSSTVSPIRVDKTPSVNPPHGEPGHNCAVPVGAPLE